MRVVWGSLQPWHFHGNSSHWNSEKSKWELYFLETFWSNWAETVNVFRGMIYCLLTINLILMCHRYQHCPTFRSHSSPCWRCFRWCGCHGQWCGSMDSCCGWRSQCCWWRRWCWCRTLSWDVGNISRRKSVMMKMLLCQRYGFCIYFSFSMYVMNKVVIFLVPYITDKGEHTTLYKVYKNVYIKLQK